MPGVLIINGGAASTSERSVTVTLPDTTAEQYLISEYIPFNDITWEDKPADGVIPFTLSSALGTKTIYVQLRDISTLTPTFSDMIELIPTGDASSAEPDTTEIFETRPDSPDPLSSNDTLPTTAELPPGCAIDIEQAYKTDGEAAVYYITQNRTKIPFSNSRVLFSYFDSWDYVNIISQECLISVPDDLLNFMPWGPLRVYKNGDILKTPSNSRVYIIINNKKNLIKSEEVFLSLYGLWELVEDVDRRVLEAFEQGIEITNAENHPDGTLVKMSDDARFYLIENQTLRFIVNEETFDSLGYRRGTEYSL